MDDIQSYRYNSPLGQVSIDSNGEAIVAVKFEKVDLGIPDPEKKPDDPLTKECLDQLNAYFDGRLRDFSLPLQPHGTDFQLKVWQLLRQIPFGRTISYRDLAKQTGDIKTIRAVGTANGRNPIPVIIPCHRVIGTDGSLVGYSGGMWRKKWLLSFENKWANGVLSLF